jgi:hypothetical protein
VFSLPSGVLTCCLSLFRVLNNQGDKWEMYIPSSLGYGKRGHPPKIPGYATLVFVMEIIKIKGAKVPAGNGTTSEGTSGGGMSNTAAFSHPLWGVLAAYCVIMGLYTFSKLPWMLGVADRLGLPNGESGSTSAYVLSPFFSTGVAQWWSKPSSAGPDGVTKYSQPFIAIHGIVAALTEFLFAAVLTASISLENARMALLVTQLPHFLLILSFRGGLGAETPPALATKINVGGVAICGLLMSGFVWVSDGHTSQWLFAGFVLVFNVPTYLDIVIVSRSCPRGAGASKATRVPTEEL